MRFEEKEPEREVMVARRLRQEMTPSEKRLWECLRGHRLDGFSFRRQRPIGRFFADLCCDKANLVVEIDGGYHDTKEQQIADAERTELIAELGYTILRVRAEHVMTNLPDVLNTIRAALHARAHHSQAPLSREAGEGQGVGAARQGVGVSSR